jgi:hypothetical protein
VATYNYFNNLIFKDGKKRGKGDNQGGKGYFTEEYQRMGTSFLY